MAIRKNLLNSVPTRKVAAGGVSSVKKYASLEYEFKNKVIGEMRSLGPESKDVKEYHIAVVCEYLEMLNLNSVRSFKASMAPGLVAYLQDAKISQKTGTNLDPSTVYAIIGTAKWMHSVMRGAAGEQFPTNKDLGVFKHRADDQNPVDFKQVLNYAENRAAISQYLIEHSAAWVASAHNMGGACGLRLSERIGTRGDTITRQSDGTLKLSPAIGKERMVTPAELSRRFGDASYGTNSKYIEVGKEYLIPEWTKGSLGRYSELYNDERRAAVYAFRAVAREMNTKSGRAIPERLAPSASDVKKAAADEKLGKDGYTKLAAIRHLENQHAYARRKLDLKEYAYTTNGDRHRDVQRQIEHGRTDQEIIRDKGHFDTDKLDYYRKRP